MQTLPRRHFINLFLNTFSCFYHFSKSIPSFRQCHDRKRYRAFLNNFTKNSLPKDSVSGAFLRKDASPAASLTVEAALALPVFLLAAGLFFSFFSAQLLQLRFQKALDEIGEDVAVWSYALDFADDYTGTDLLTLADGGALSGALAGNGEDISYLLSQEADLLEEMKLFLMEKGSALVWQQLLKQWLIAKVGRERLDRSVLQDGADGVSLSGSTLHDRELDLVLSYRIAPLFGRVFGVSAPVVQRSCRRLWIGTKVVKEEEEETGEEEQEETVYVTERGSAYHKDLNCRVFHVDPVSVPLDAIPSLRNEEGKIYYPCDRCVLGRPEPLIAWVTDFGTRYHYDKNCPGMKRTVIEMALSEAREKYRPCGFCGGDP
jgi:hypothetical protein